MIAITYDKENNTVFQHFGRTEYFYLFDLNTNEEKIIDNGGLSIIESLSRIQALTFKESKARTENNPTHIK